MNDNSLKKMFEEWIKINLVNKKLGLIDIKNKFIDDVEENDEILHNSDDFDKTISKLIMNMVSEEKLCKEEKNGKTKFYYNPNLYSDTQNIIINKQKRNKKIIITIISFFLISILVFIIYNNIKENEKIKQQKEEIANAEKEMAESIISEIAKKYNLSDVKYEYIEYGSLSSTVIYTTNQYEKLTDKEKLQLIVDIASKTHLTKPFPSGSEAADSYFDIAIMSNGHKYTDFTFDGQSELMKDKKTIYKMPTDYAESIDKSLKSSINSSDSDSSTGKKYYSVQYNYSGCYPNKPHYVCYEKDRCRCVANP